MLRTLLIAAAVAWSIPVAAGSDTALTYQTPPDPLTRLVDAPLSPRVVLSPDAAWMALAEQPSLPGIEEVSRPELGLAGVRIDPRTNGPSRGRYYTGLSFVEVATGRARTVGGLPKTPRLDDLAWSPNGQHLAFTTTRPTGIAVWVASPRTGKARKLTSHLLNAATGAPCRWLPDSSALICNYVPPGRGQPPVEAEVPTGPVVRQSAGKEAPARTYQNLLESPHDEALFDHYFTGQLALVPLRGKIRPIGAPGVLVAWAPSPDGKHLLVEQVHRPYSYLVPMSRFPLRSEIWDLAGKPQATIADLPLAEDIPVAFGSVRTGRRAIDWRADAPATLYWAEAQDRGDARKKARIRDRLMVWSAPFSGQPRALVDLPLRFGGITWGTGDVALVSEWWWQTRKTRTYQVAPDRPGAKPRVVWDRSWEDRYADPGSPLLRDNAAGRSVLRLIDGHTLLLTGDGASPEGDRPFLDRLDLRTGKSERLFRSEAPRYEQPIEVLDDAAGKVLLASESRTEPMNVVILDRETGARTQLTRFPHPTPELQGIQKELIRYRRADGVMLTATLYTPAGYDPKKDGRLPMLMWAYPQEYKSKEAASQVTDSPYRFDRVGWWSPLLFLTQGYAVLDDPSMPIIGEGKREPNDTYVKQLAASARAAVREVVRRGVADRRRIAIGGHSYGAFMAANLLAHTDLFRAGIARSGAYNRTLTPFGFQSEERTFWDAPEVYFAMSPFMHAKKIDEPLLIIHGAADDNPGTYPMQSERLYEAMKGLGGLARLVLLPAESHGYRARESILHMLWETSAWLDEHLENGAATRSATR